MDRIYRYNPKVSYEPNEERYLQLMSAKDLYIQNVLEYDNHSDSFQVQVQNVFTNYMNGGMRLEDQKVH